MQVSKGTEIEINVCGSSTFGRYKKISLEQTWNLFLSDNWLVNYAGFQQIVNILTGGIGRGLFYSVRGKFLIAVISSSVYKIDTSFSPLFIGNIDTSVGEVFIDENLSNQICLVDGLNAYIYNYVDAPVLTVQILTVNFISDPPTPAYVMIPGYVCYHNTFFLIASSPSSPNSSAWCAFQFATPSTIAFVPQSQFLLQTKPDVALAVERIPGKGNHVLVLGSTVAEIWNNVGGIQNYQRVASLNIDYGLASISSLASGEQFVCWLAQNENNSPIIMYTDGSAAQIISSDGIDYVLEKIQFPAQSTAFFYRQDGHLFYQLTFYNPADNLTLIYDFTTQKFFHGSDQNLNFHPARKIVFFDEATYFISLSDGALYEMDTDYVTYNYTTDPNNMGDEIPRIRICKTIRKPNSDRFRCGQFTFWIEEGMRNLASPVLPRVDMSVSKNGNQSFSNIVGRELNPEAVFRNQIRWHRIGQCNELTIQLRFWGFTRFVANNGTMEIY